MSVVVPTRNEAGNIAALVSRLDAAFGASRIEIIFVDDSEDETPQCIEDVAGWSPRPVGLLHRAAGSRAGGLGSAVLAGLRMCTGEWAVVMDGDLQHPPEVIPDLVAAGSDTGSDIVVGSRYVGDGSAAGLGSVGRWAVSGGATRMTKAVFPKRLHGCTDPMSGLFAVRLAALDLDRLRPNGFKILLEILARSPRLRVHEHPFSFGVRHSGESKASWREAILLARRLGALRLATLLGPRQATLAGFLAVGLTGIAVNSLALWALVELLGLPVLLAATLATQVSTTWNFLLTDRLVYPGAKARRGSVRYLSFSAVNNLALLARLPLLSLLVHQAGMAYLTANAITLAAAFAVRFALSDRLVFTRRNPMTKLLKTEMDAPRQGLRVAAPVPGQRRSGPVDLLIDLRDGALPPVRHRKADTTWHYDVHGIVRIDSAVRLPELETFRADAGGTSDIVIRVGRFDGSRLRRRSQVTQFAGTAGVSYAEQLGRFGSDFMIDMSGGGIEVVVGPMLRRSPHVLYTNVVEALLRFVLVSRGYMLLHSACMELDGRGILLSALTDTGKTGTVLRLLRENDSRFLSDDMTILDATGKALCYPKPLTISQHTLRAVQAGDLTRAEWRRLRVQSRLHSKEGRGIGARLGEMNVPIMSLNAVTQFVVPPPKYTVDRLVPCRMATSVQIEDLFIIERNAFHLSDISPDVLLDELIANTDDAYGFPPFRYFAPALVVGGNGYEELRAQERLILAAAMRAVRTRRLATPDYTWADHIPGLAGQEFLSEVPQQGRVDDRDLRDAESA